eukprot:NODE_1027_length_627_cov_82.103806_g955_i0.p3 GENE.NODE_1027_length_627_cov_82.103806_g955_i0~~NODE_1027_length_627_cov_82.103806_g955_i0.p3  ORF type:complete len:64 (+),score=9.52 NODE_1027_length_627_cov_82.103806_g955_i0:320-511(+)
MQDDASVDRQLNPTVYSIGWFSSTRQAQNTTYPFRSIPKQLHSDNPACCACRNKTEEEKALTF